MGGLVNGSTVKGDLWMIEGGQSSMACYPVGTTFEGPGPRVGHASLLVGNAFIVFGGDTKMDERDKLDDTLYLLNTCKCRLNRYLCRADIDSNTSLVKVNASWTAPSRSLRSYAEHLGIKDLRVRWTSGRSFFQRLARFRSQRPSKY